MCVCVYMWLVSAPCYIFGHIMLSDLCTLFLVMVSAAFRFDVYSDFFFWVLNGFCHSSLFIYIMCIILMFSDQFGVGINHFLLFYSKKHTRKIWLYEKETTILLLLYTSYMYKYSIFSFTLFNMNDKQDQQDTEIRKHMDNIQHWNKKSIRIQNRTSINYQCLENFLHPILQS